MTSESVFIWGALHSVLDTQVQVEFKMPNRHDQKRTLTQHKIIVKFLKVQDVEF